MDINKILVLISCFFAISISAQNDCTDAIVVCGNSGYNNLSVVGAGKQELNGSNITCYGAENNSIWFKLNINKGGSLAFTLTPSTNDINEDFDFYIFANTTCDNLGQSIRCSTTNPYASGQSNNLTGLVSSETDVSEGPGQNGNSFLKPLDVKAGETYFLVIDRPIGSSNFTLDWTGTAKFYDAPTIIDTSIKALDLKECGTINDTTAEFDLTQNTAIVNGQNNVVVTYHTNNNDAILNENSIDTSTTYINESNPQTIFMRLTNTVTECFTIEDFTITADKKRATKPEDFVFCDDSNSGSDTDGIVKFSLSLKDNEVLGTYTANDFNISYHRSKEDAKNNRSPLDKNRYENTSVTQSIFIRFEEKKTGCVDISKSFQLVVNALPTINNRVTLKQCDDDTDGLTIFNLNEAKQLISSDFENLDFTFYTSKSDALTSDITKQIPDVERYKNAQSSGESVWVLVTNSNKCSRISEVQLEVSTTQIPSNFFLTYEQCDEPDADKNYDGFSSFDLSDIDKKIKDLFPLTQKLLVSVYENEEDALIEKNEITDLSSYKNKTQNTQSLYVRVDSEDENTCIGLGEHIKLVVNNPPSFDVESPKEICMNTASSTLDVLNPMKTYTYKWGKEGEVAILGTTSSIEVKEGGTYLITATDTDTQCTITKKIIVKELFVPKISKENVVIDDKNNSIKLSISIEGTDNEFALYSELNELLEDYKKDSYFEVTLGGIYKIYVRNGCGISTLILPVLQFPKFFTPNNDSFNDTWEIKGVNSVYFKEGTIFIFDRFGKILSKQNLKTNSWNGVYNGITLPSNDYWYEVRLTTNDGLIIKETGHFSLLRD